MIEIKKWKSDYTMNERVIVLFRGSLRPWFVCGWGRETVLLIQGDILDD